MISALLSMRRQAYKKALKNFLDEAPGGCFFNEDRFDQDTYNQLGLQLCVLHRQAKVSLAGIPTTHEPSWNWDDRSAVMYFVSPINVTRLRAQVEQYERTEKKPNIYQYELAF